MNLSIDVAVDIVWTSSKKNKEMVIGFIAKSFLFSKIALIAVAVAIVITTK